MLLAIMLNKYQFIVETLKQILHEPCVLTTNIQTNYKANINVFGIWDVRSLIYDLWAMICELWSMACDLRPMNYDLWAKKTTTMTMAGTCNTTSRLCCSLSSSPRKETRPPQTRTFNLAKLLCLLQWKLASWPGNPSLLMGLGTAPKISSEASK